MSRIHFMKNILLINFILISILFSCKIEELKTPPVVKTNSSSEISSSSAKIWGEVVEEGSSAATERGFVYSDKNPSPSTSDFKVVSGFGKGEFNIVISSLSPKTKYYFKAYATNQSGIAYGDVKDFTTIDDIKLPTLTTSIVTNISISGCTSGGIITSDGGAVILEKGVVYSTSANPTISNNKLISTGANNYSLDLSGLAQNTTYYIRAFATNSKGTNYGDQQVFTTLKNFNSILKDGLVAYYPFNGNANDLSGNSNNGTVNGAVLVDNRFGISNSAFYFSSQNCSPRIEAIVNTTSISQALTISIWVKQAGNGCSSPRILDFASSPINGAGQLQWSFSYQNFWSLLHLKSNVTEIKSSNFPTGPFAWTHLVYTNDGIICKFYQDGKLVGSTPNGVGKPILARNLTIGRMNHPAYDAFNGNLDDIGVWNRELTSEEIKFLYENDFRP